jgi:hypothetical protein
MTEAQLRAFLEFKALPIYDESDPRANALTFPPGAGPYKGVRECSTVQEVVDCLKDSHLVPLGGLRAANDGGPVVVAYFGEKR